MSYPCNEIHQRPIDLLCSGGRKHHSIHCCIRSYFQGQIQHYHQFEEPYQHRLKLLAGTHWWWYSNQEFKSLRGFGQHRTYLLNHHNHWRCWCWWRGWPLLPFPEKYRTSPARLHPRTSKYLTLWVHFASSSYLFSKILTVLWENLNNTGKKCSQCCPKKASKRWWKWCQNRWFSITF